jgi:hypothetical protein
LDKNGAVKRDSLIINTDGSNFPFKNIFDTPDYVADFLAVFDAFIFIVIVPVNHWLFPFWFSALSECCQKTFFREHPETTCDNLPKILKLLTQLAMTVLRII